jgi:hypothetical protein
MTDNKVTFSILQRSVLGILEVMATRTDINELRWITTELQYLLDKLQRADWDAQRSNAPQGNAPQGNAPQGNAPQGD